VAVNVDRSIKIATAFAKEITRAPDARLCRACAEVLVVAGAGITLMGGGRAGGPVCVSNPRMAALEDLQFTLGVGPCQDAFSSGAPVRASRMDEAASLRWPSFVGLAQATGVGAVFAYPLFTHGARVGVMTLYQDGEGDLTIDQHEDSLAVAEVLTETVLSLQAEAPAGTLAPGLEEAVAYRAEIHQASGMVAIQLRVAVDEALLRIRAHAFATNRPITVVASDIVARRLRLDHDDSRSPDED
jgi:hypothetical protein